jgi:hypothetical protein
VKTLSILIAAGLLSASYLEAVPGCPVGEEAKVQHSPYYLEGELAAKTYFETWGSSRPPLKLMVYGETHNPYQEPYVDSHSKPLTPENLEYFRGWHAWMTAHGDR